MKTEQDFKTAEKLAKAKIQKLKRELEKAEEELKSVRNLKEKVIGRIYGGVHIQRTNRPTVYIMTREDNKQFYVIHRTKKSQIFKAANGKKIGEALVTYDTRGWPPSVNSLAKRIKGLAIKS